MLRFRLIMICYTKAILEAIKHGMIIHNFKKKLCL